MPHYNTLPHTRELQAQISEPSNKPSTCTCFSSCSCTFSCACVSSVIFRAHCHTVHLRQGALNHIPSSDSPSTHNTLTEITTDAFCTLAQDACTPTKVTRQMPRSNKSSKRKTGSQNGALLPLHELDNDVALDRTCLHVRRRLCSLHMAILLKPACLSCTLPLIVCTNARLCVSQAGAETTWASVCVGSWMWTSR